MKYIVTHRTKYFYSQPVPVCHNLVHLRPRVLLGQYCEDFQLVVHPKPNDLAERIDSFGNPETYFSIEQPHIDLNITATSKLEKRDSQPIPLQSKPWDSLVNRLSCDRSIEYLEPYEFAFATERTLLFPALVDWTRPLFPKGRPIVEACQELTHRIYTDFQYAPGTTNVSTSIEEVFHTKQGVCQDFAHLQLACLRSLGIAARYISGYVRTIPPPGQERLVGADASHAWVSVFCGDLGWIDFDPTNDVVPSMDHITLAWGRDYHDVAPVKGVILGGGEHRMSVSVDVEPGD